MIFRPLLCALAVVLLLSPVPGTASPQRFNVTGHWTGTITIPQLGTAPIDLHLQAGKGSAFTGSGTAGEGDGLSAVSVLGTLAPSGKATLKLTAPADHGTATLTGQLTAASRTISGKLTSKGPGQPAQKGMFTITQRPE